VSHTGGEAHGLSLALQPHPGRPGVGQPIEGAAVERRAADGEKHEETLEFHDATLPHRASAIVIR
jgi:hypothetical protein